MADLAVSVAGRCAELIAFPELGDRPNPNRDDLAWTDADAWRCTADLGAMGALIADVTVRVTEWLITDWRLVERIAYALLMARPERLNADDIRRLVPCRRVPARAFLPFTSRDVSSGAVGGPGQSRPRAAQVA